jgi:hypothetical protein
MWTAFIENTEENTRPKRQFTAIYIETSRQRAIKIFIKRFQFSPINNTCDCCGNYYDIFSRSSLQEVTAEERGCYEIYNHNYITKYLESIENIPDGWQLSNDYDEKTDSYKSPELREVIKLEDYLTRPDIFVVNKSNF